MKKALFSFQLMILIGLWSSCSKPLEIQEKATSIKSHSSYREAYPLNWESITYMPAPPNTTQIGVPWSYGINSTHFSSDIKNDFNSQDGWVLIYNTFNTQVIVPHQYFILYNIYRGLIRYYYYIPSGANYIPSSNIVHKLELQGSSRSGSISPSPLLNYADQRIVDLDTNSVQASKLEPYQVDPGSWYVLQYELAYDKNINNFNNQSLYFKWKMTSNTIQSVQLAGTQSGTLTGTIQQPGIDLTVSPNLVGRGSIVVNGEDDANKLNILQALKNGIKDGITQGVAGVVKDFISGLFGSAGGTTTEFKVQTNIDLKGSIQQSYSISNLDFLIPGYNQDPNITYTPLYNKPLGVFYLANKPLVKTTKSGQGRNAIFEHQIDMSSINIDYNPAVTTLASISVKKVEMLARVPDNATADETIDGVPYMVGSQLTTYGQTTQIDGVRITLTVTPNNGRSPVTISKTFKVKRALYVH